LLASYVFVGGFVETNLNIRQSEVKSLKEEIVEFSIRNIRKISASVNKQIMAFSLFLCFSKRKFV